jgi:hypothetical protein
VGANPFMIIKDFLVVKIQFVPLIFTHFVIASDFESCEILQFLNKFITLMCGRVPYDNED